MTGEQIARLMVDPALKRALAKSARRYSKCVEDQEEYIADAWCRISEQPGDMSITTYAEHGARAMMASYQRGRYARVEKKSGQNLNGIGRRAITAKPRDAIYLGERRYLNRKPTRLSAWYYEGEWLEYGLTHDDLRSFSVHEIVVLTQ